MNNRQYSQDVTLVSRRSAVSKRKLLSLPGCLIGLTLCMILTVVAFGVYYFLSPGGRAGPLVLIHAPQNGRHFVAGQPITVQAVATDPRKIVRVELWVDGQLLKSETSNVSGGIASFPLLADWQPASAGAHMILVRAFNGLGVRAHSSIKVDVVSDRDGDGAADDADVCPDQPGFDTAKGCPDRDADGTPDSADTCPDVAGVPEAAGCAAATEGDRDGDGSPDVVDACPDVAGSSLLEGCPDSDGDLIADIHDACATEPGASNGCPVPAGDADGDGVLDSEDVCPSEWGLPEYAGCPDDGVLVGTGTRDSDGDGASDDVDPCPFEAGIPEFSFCPEPIDDLTGTEPEWPDLSPGGAGISNLVEFEALHFQVTQEYNEVWCYVRLGDGDLQRYDFAPGEERQWNIAEVLGGENSVHLGLAEGDPVRVFVDCLGSMDPAERPHSLGFIDQQHSAEAWDATRVIEADSIGGEAGHSFQARYRLCVASCAETGLPPPMIRRYVTYADRIYLDWAWEGDTSTLSGFKLYLNGNFIQAFTNDRSDDTLFPPAEIPCAERWEFYLTAFTGTDVADPDLESPPGNSVSWEGMPCQEQIRVTFASLNLHTPPEDEGWENQPGPITGDFIVSSSADFRSIISFDAAYCAIVPFIGEQCFGRRLYAGENSIQGILDEIHVSPDACDEPACAYWASESATVTVPADLENDLTIGARIMDVDANAADDTLFDGYVNIDTAGLRPDSTYTLIIPGEYANLTVLVDLFPFEP